MKKHLPLLLFCLLTGKNFSQTVTDADGNTYNTVTIGSQVWMKENLKTTKYNDGTAIPYHTGPDGWFTLTTPAYCWNRNDQSYKATYGALYNWLAVNTGKLCPVNWRVPTQEDFNTLIAGQGGLDIAGGKLKKAGATHWTGLTGSTNIPNAGADNSSGFTALPGGFLDPENSPPNFHTPGIDAFFWSASEKENCAWCIIITVYSLKVHLVNDYQKPFGMSIRCIKALNAAVINPGYPPKKTVYPNPATDKLYIHQDRFDHPVVIIFDLQGREILKQKMISDNIDISILPKGVYLVNVTGWKNSDIERIIKQ